MQLVIRPQTEADCKQLAAIEREIFDCETISLRSFRNFLNSPRIATFVAVSSDRIVGYATVFFRARSKIARTYSIAVRAEHRGTGLGQTLLEKCESVARERDCEFLRLEVKADNPKAISFYQKRGFTQYGIREAYYEDGTTALLLRKAL